MGDDDEASASTEAQQRAELPYQVATGENIDDGAAGAGITITSGGTIDTVRVKVPGMDEFETGPDQLREWLEQHGMIHTQHQRTAIEEQIDAAIQRGHATHQPAGGEYHWDEYTPGSHADDQMRESLNEAQSQDWQRMLNSWNEFERQVHDLRSIANDDAEAIIRQVGHTVTALDMIESAGWTQSCQTELGAWAGLSTDGMSPEAIHAAAASIADAGDQLMQAWHAALEAGNYDSAHLTPNEQAFIDACAHARTGLHQ
jgi:hypothetical protein